MMKKQELKVVPGTGTGEPQLVRLPAFRGGILRGAFAAVRRRLSASMPVYVIALLSTLPVYGGELPLIEPARGVIGLHTITLHSQRDFAKDNYFLFGMLYIGTTREDYRTATPGIYYKAASGFTAGAYSNSFGDPAIYAGWTLETPEKRFWLTAGGVYGYRAGPDRKRILKPLLVGGIAARLDRDFGWTADFAKETTVRLGFIPDLKGQDNSPYTREKRAHALTLMVERAF